jgi:hypothetical protein
MMLTRMPQPIPSYLLAFAVGDLRFRELGPRTGIYAEPHVLDAAAWEFEDTERRLAAAEDLYGPYLWDRYDLLVMPPSFPYGGMENPRLTFVTPLAIRGDRSRTSLVSHELGHAWLGNLVTNATWEDFWLNEGWTTYAQDRISELIEGPEFAGLEFLLSQDQLREDLAAFGHDSALTCLKTSLKGVDPDDAFSTVPYSKGELLLLSLERSVGRDTFDAFSRTYISDHQFRSLTTEEFLVYVQQKLPAAAEHVDIREWLYGTGLPSNLPEVKSILYDRVKESIAAYHDGALPRTEEVSGWHPLQMGIFIRLLPERIPSEHCRYLGGLFQMAGSRNKNLLFEYCRLCVRSEYRAILPEIESFVAEVGNLYMLTRLFRCLVGIQWTRDAARPMFERARDRYHPITAAAIEKILAEAEL